MNFLKCCLVLFCVFPACNFNPDKQVVPAWTMDFLGPIVKADMNIQNIYELDDLHANLSLSLSDFSTPTPTGTMVIPPVPSTNLGPYTMDLTNAFGNADIASGDLSYKITNNLEINVNAGTTVIMKQGSTTLLSNPTNNIAAFGGTYTSPVTLLSNTNILSDISLSIQNFSSNGSGGNLVTIDPNRKLILEIFLKNIKIKSITLTNANSFSITDTSNFNIKGNGIPSQTVSGTFTMYLTNNIPLNFDLQVYFLDDSKTLLDSLFDSPSTIIKATSVPSETILVTKLNNRKINNLNKASIAQTKLMLNTGANTTIPNSLFMKMQIVGDLQIRLNK
jgi:hypothetical protein